MTGIVHKFYDERLREYYNDRRNQTTTVTVPVDDEQAQWDWGFRMFDSFYNLASSTEARQDDGTVIRIDTYQRPYVDADGFIPVEEDAEKQFRVISSVIATDGMQMPYSHRDAKLREWARSGYFLVSSVTVVHNGETSIEDTLMQRFYKPEPVKNSLRSYWDKVLSFLRK